mgnify:CR=1 FL=1
MSLAERRSKRNAPSAKRARPGKAPSLAALRQALRDFAAERDWDQFHTPKNLAAALIVEAAELLEHFQWLTAAESAALPPEKLRGSRVTRLGTRRWQNVFEERCDPRGRIYYWLAGDAVDAPGEAGTDVEAVREGFTSITPVHFDLTDYKVMETIGDWLQDKAARG